MLISIRQGQWAQTIRIQSGSASRGASPTRMITQVLIVSSQLPPANKHRSHAEQKAKVTDTASIRQGQWAQTIQIQSGSASRGASPTRMITQVLIVSSQLPPANRHRSHAEQRAHVTDTASIRQGQRAQTTQIQSGSASRCASPTRMITQVLIVSSQLPPVNRHRSHAEQKANVTDTASVRQDQWAQTIRIHLGLHRAVLHRLG